MSGAIISSFIYLFLFISRTITTAPLKNIIKIVILKIKENRNHQCRRVLCGKKKKKKKKKKEGGKADF